MERYQNNILALVGPPFVGLTPVPGVGLECIGFTVAVKNFPALTTASLFSDNGITPSANPIVVPSSGEFHFYAANGRYQLEIVKIGIVSKTIPDVLISDPGDAVGAVGIGTPASVAANSTLEHILTLPGLTVGDFVAVVKPTHQAGLMVGSCSVSSTNTLAVTFMNTTAAGIIPTPGEIYILNHQPQ